jgi:hypothetical protein
VIVLVDVTADPQRVPITEAIVAVPVVTGQDHQSVTAYLDGRQGYRLEVALVRFSRFTRDDLAVLTQDVQKPANRVWIRSQSGAQSEMPHPISANYEDRSGLFGSHEHSPCGALNRMWGDPSEESGFQGTVELLPER